MKCKYCPEGRRFASGSVNCLLYGMVIREDHEGTMEGCGGRGKHADEDAGKYGAVEVTARLPEDEWDAVDALPGLLPGA